MPLVPKRKKQPVDDRPTAFGVHIFAGGFTCGVKQAGFNVLAHFEDTDYGVATAKANWPDLRICVGKENWSLSEMVDVDFMYSNPPCSIFSLVGITRTKGREAWRSDPRLDCWYRAFESMFELEPKVFALESVCQAYTKGRPVVDEFTIKCFNMGYSIAHVFEDAVWTGIPQHRKRFFFIAYKPQLNMLKYLKFDYGNMTTVGDALRLIKDSGPHGNDANGMTVVSKARPGDKLCDVFNEMNGLDGSFTKGKRVKGRVGFTRFRLDMDSQMGGFIGNFYMHPTEPRFLGINEMKAVCGYPQEFIMADIKFDSDSANNRGAADRYAQHLCRAVMPPVGKWLAEAVKSALNDVNPNNKQHVVFLDLRTPIGRRRTITDDYAG